MVATQRSSCECGNPKLPRDEACEACAAFDGDGLSPTARQILAELRVLGPSSVRALTEAIPNRTQRTIYRGLEALMRMGRVVRSVLHDPYDENLWNEAVYLLGSTAPQTCRIRGCSRLVLVGGLCGTHSNPNWRRAENRRRSRRRVRGLHAEGRCTACARRDGLTAAGRYLCQPCYVAQSVAAAAKRHENAEVGLCPCGRQRSGDRHLCLRCRRQRSDSQRRRREELRKEGLCQWCTTTPVGGPGVSTAFCAEHHRRHIENQRRLRSRNAGRSAIAGS